MNNWVRNHATKFRGWLKKPSAADWIVAAFTVVLAVVAGQQARITENQLKLTQTDERAWVEARVTEPQTVDVTVDSPISVSLTIKNTGKTAARHVKVAAMLVTEPAKDPVPLQCLNDLREGCGYTAAVIGTFFPNDPQTVTVFRTIRDKRVSATVQEATDYQSDKLYTAVLGRVHYQDIFGVWHWTNFCYWNTKDSQTEQSGFNTESCVAYNDTLEASDDLKQ